MDKQAFIAAYIAKNTSGRHARGPAIPAEVMMAQAEKAWETSQDPHAQFVSKLAAKGNYWKSEDGSKVRVYFDDLTVPSVRHTLVRGYYDVKAKEWVSTQCDGAEFGAVVIATFKI